MLSQNFKTLIVSAEDIPGQQNDTVATYHFYNANSSFKV